MVYVIIILLTLLSLFVFSLFEPVKTWKKNFTSRPLTSALIVFSFFAPFLGNLKGGDIKTYIPDTVRYFRMLDIIILAGLSSARIIANLNSLAKAGFPIFLILFYTILAMVSSSYSSAPLVSLWKGFEIFSLCLVCISISGELRNINDFRYLLNVIKFCLLYLTLSVLVGLVFFPQEAIKTTGNSWAAFYVRGIIPIINPNSVSQIGAFLATLESIRILTGEGRNKFLFFLGIIIALLGHSRTSIFSLIICLFIILFYLRRKWLIIILPLTGIIITFGGVYIWIFLLRGQTIEGFLSLSGRIDFWKNVWHFFAQSPFIGHGYYAFHRVRLGVSTVDNTYIEVLLDVGILGFVFFVIPLIYSIIKLIQLGANALSEKFTYRKEFLELTCIFIILFIRSLTGPSFEVLHWNFVIYGIFLIKLSYYIRLVKDEERYKKNR